MTKQSLYLWDDSASSLRIIPVGPLHVRPNKNVTAAAYVKGMHA